MYCQHTFNNKPFFLPYDYNEKIKRYKIMGNFCSPNCVKAYALNSKIYSNKMYIIGQMYRKLFTANFNIKPSPPINLLRCYGGTMSIEEFRSTFYKNKDYVLHNINCKIQSLDIIEKPSRI